MDLVQIDLDARRPAPKPEWLKARAPVGDNYHDLKKLARSLACTRFANQRTALTSESAGITRRPLS